MTGLNIIIIPAKLNTVELDAKGFNMRSKVREYLSSILDKVEDKIQATIKRPPEYENSKQEKEPLAKTPVETSVNDIIDSKLHYNNKRNVIRLYLCKIVEDAAAQSQVRAPHILHCPYSEIFILTMPSFMLKSVSAIRLGLVTEGEHFFIICTDLFNVS